MNDRYKIKKCAFIFFIILSSFFIMPNHVIGSDIYYINKDRVFLLYKVINWWNDCLAGESNKICGSLIRCKNAGNVQLDYNEAGMKLKLEIKDGFASLLSVFKQCDRCKGPSFLKATWLNKKYFGDGEAIVLRSGHPTITPLFFNKIAKKSFQRIQDIEQVLEFELEGIICGLMNGKIALYQGDKFIKTCYSSSKNKDFKHPINLRLANSQTGEILAKYSIE